MRTKLNSALIPGPDWSWGWRWDAESNPLPTFAACVTMDEHRSLTPALKTQLAQYLAPLQSVQQGRGEDSAFV